MRRALRARRVTRRKKSQSPRPFSPRYCIHADLNMNTSAMWHARDRAHCAWSLRESFDFFCESDADWEVKRQLYIERLRQSQVDEHAASFVFWQNNWEPNFACNFEARPGDPGDGSKWLCDPHKLKHSKRCVLYSFGSAGNFMWEISMHERLGSSCEIHTFDHTLKFGSVHPPAYVHYHYWGIGTKDQWADKERSVGIFTLATIQQMLGHEGVFIEVLKIDVEGAEYSTIQPLVAAQRFEHVHQLLIELHYERVPTKYPPRPTRSHPWSRLAPPAIVQPPAAHHAFFWTLTHAGWAIFHKEPNTAYAMGGCVEYAFVRLSWNTTDLLRIARQKWCIGGWRNLHSTMHPVCDGWGVLREGEPMFKHNGYETDHEGVLELDPAHGTFRSRVTRKQPPPPPRRNAR